MGVVFGTGHLYLKESTGATPNAIRIGSASSVSLDISQEFVTLQGDKIFPKNIANGAATGSGSFTVDELNPNIVKAAFGGAAESVGYEELVPLEAATIPSASPYTLTTTGLKEDYGVEYASGVSLLRVASAPTAGQYSVDEATGTYTFAAADAGKAIKRSYVKTVAGSGKTITYANQLLGAGNSYRMRLWNSYEGRKVGIYLPAVKIGGGTHNFAAAAHLQPEYSYQIFEGEDGSVGKWFFA